jgi:hypothetical protein
MSWIGVAGRHLEPVNQQLASKWCRDNVGTMNYSKVGPNFYFKNPEDATLFKLKWG